MSYVALLTGPTSAIGKLVHANLVSEGVDVINCYSSGSEEGRAYFNLLSGENNLSLFQFDRVIHLAWVMRDRSEAAQVTCQRQTKVLIGIAKARQARFDFLSSVEAEGGESNYALAKLSVEKALDTYKAASIVRAGIMWGVSYVNPLLEFLAKLANVPGVCPHVVSTRRFFFTNLFSLSEDIVNCQPSGRISSFNQMGYSLSELCHRMRRKRAFVHLRIPIYPLAGIRGVFNRVGLHYATLDRIAALVEINSGAFRFQFSEYGKNHGLPPFMHDSPRP